MTHTLAGPSTAADWTPKKDSPPVEVFGLAVSYEIPIPRGDYELIFFEGAFKLPVFLKTKIPLLLEHDRSRRLADTCQYWETEGGLRFSAVIQDKQTVEAIANRELFPSIRFAEYGSLERDGLLAVSKSFLREISLVTNPGCRETNCVALQNSKLVRPPAKNRLARGSHVPTHNTWHRVAVCGIF